MKKIISIFLYFICLLVQGQGQLGIAIGLNRSSIKSDDFISIKPSNGLSIGLTVLGRVYEKADWLLGLSYETGSFFVEGYKGFNNEDVLINGPNNVNISGVDAKFIFNQYLIVPEAATFQVGVQAGLGLSMLVNFKSENLPPFPEELAQFKPFYIFGLSGGTEKYRINLNYSSILGNTLKNISARDRSEGPSSGKLREFVGSQSTITLSFTVFITNFNY